MHLHYVLKCTGPREPDLGCDSLEIDDGELATSYMEVTYPQALDVMVVPASPNSSWMNLVFNDHKESRKPSNTQPPNQGVEGEYKQVYSRKVCTHAKLAQLMSLRSADGLVQTRLQALVSVH